MGAMASQITSLKIVYSTVYSDADQEKNQSSASLAFMRGVHRWPGDSPHKGPVKRNTFPFDDVIMKAVQLWTMKYIVFPQNWIQNLQTLICVAVTEGIDGCQSDNPQHWTKNEVKGVTFLLHFCGNCMFRVFFLCWPYIKSKQSYSAQLYK